MKIKSEYVLFFRLKTAFEMSFMDNDFLYIPIYFQLQETFKDLYIFETYQNEPLSRDFVQNKLKELGIYSDWYLTEYFAYLSGNYIKIPISNEIKNLYSLIKSTNKADNLLSHQLFSGLFSKS